MLRKKIVILLLTAAVLLSGCGKRASGRDEETGSAGDSAAASVAVTAESEPAEPAVETQETQKAGYEYDPHLYLPMLEDDVPQDYWDSFYSLCDALRAGEETFECSSEAAYRWATDPGTLGQLFPAACTKIGSVNENGSLPYENGTATILYRMPADEFAQRQADFEAAVTGVLNTYLEQDDDDFEKCLKLYDYMSTHYTYEYEFVEYKSDGAVYLAIMDGTGECIELAGVYAFLLLQSGVEAIQVGCSNEEISHAWVYLVLDGKSYHSDPTWALRAEDEDDPLGLYYFLMTGERRADSGCAVDDLTASLLPKYWANMSSVAFTAEDDTYCFPSGSFLASLDEENKTVHYRCNGEELAFQYAQAH